MLGVRPAACFPHVVGEQVSPLSSHSVDHRINMRPFGFDIDVGALFQSIRYSRDERSSYIILTVEPTNNITRRFLPYIVDCLTTNSRKKKSRIHELPTPRLDDSFTFTTIRTLAIFTPLSSSSMIFHEAPNFVEPWPARPLCETNDPYFNPISLSLSYGLEFQPSIRSDSIPYHSRMEL